MKKVLMVYDSKQTSTKESGKVENLIFYLDVYFSFLFFFFFFRHILLFCLFTLGIIKKLILEFRESNMNISYFSSSCKFPDGDNICK